MNHLFEIPDSEKERFKKIIHKYRAEYIPSNPTLIDMVFQKEADVLNKIRNESRLSDTIQYLRQKVYDEFLLEESKFNVQVLKDLERLLETPREILEFVTEDLTKANLKGDKLVQRVHEMCGEYAGRVCPYIYQLSLSNTNSRRSRAGKTFEAIIYKMYEVHGFKFESQKKIGKSEFQKRGLGKIVDSLLPGVAEFEQRRDKVIIGTMKTTLRERWQEVIEEISRTGLPQIYLLTMDDDISVSKAEQMGKHNIVLVVPENVKSTDGLRERRNIISFEDYFLNEVPEKLGFWL